MWGGGGGPEAGRAGVGRACVRACVCVSVCVCVCVRQMRAEQLGACFFNSGGDHQPHFRRSKSLGVGAWKPMSNFQWVGSMAKRGWR